MDTRKPRMFSDEPAEDVLGKAKKISDLKKQNRSSNLRPLITTPEEEAVDGIVPTS